jgi:hypothetical protein
LSSGAGAGLANKAKAVLRCLAGDGSERAGFGGGEADTDAAQAMGAFRSGDARVLLGLSKPFGLYLDHYLVDSQAPNRGANPFPESTFHDFLWVESSNSRNAELCLC